MGLSRVGSLTTTCFSYFALSNYRHCNMNNHQTYLTLVEITRYMKTLSVGNAQFVLITKFMSNMYVDDEDPNQVYVKL